MTSGEFGLVLQGVAQMLAILVFADLVFTDSGED